MKVREIAFNILESVFKNKSYSNIELNKQIRESSLSSLDKALLTRIVYGSLKDSNILNYEIAKATDNKDIKPKVRTLLKLSLYQLRYMDKVPSYAVINEAVEIAKDKMGLMTSKFVNAVLRRLSKETFVPKKEDYKDESLYYSIVYGLPSWVIHMLIKQYSLEETIEYLKAYKLEAPVIVRVNNLKSSKEELLKLGYYQETKMSNVGLIYKGDKSINELKEFLDGKMVVQGESSQLSSLLLNPSKNDIILDMCAAPGGKTYHLADLLNNTGHIHSIDLYDHRVKLIANNLPRLGIKNVSLKHGDSTDLSKYYEREYFDKILLDAPCSGLGVIRRKPDIVFNINQNSLDELISIQEKLLDEAHRLLKKNGEMVYSTCTLNKKENELQIKNFLDKYKDMILLEEKSLFPSEEIIDGFYMAKLKRK